MLSHYRQLALILHINEDCTALLLPITKGEDILRSAVPLSLTEQDELAQITHPEQRIEWLSCRQAMQELAEVQGITYTGLYKDEYGKPHLVGASSHISLSHTSGWVAVTLHRTQPVGIDIEAFRDQFRRVVPRVLSDPEIAHAAGDTSRLAVYWCAKEALYKLYGKRRLTFREHLHIDPFDDGADHLSGHVRLPNHEEQTHPEPIKICCFRIGPGLLAVAF